jgi:NADPH2:quinone reductase
MKAAVLGADGVEFAEFPVPSPQPHEVLVRVRACGLNRADLLVAMGHSHGKVGGPFAIGASPTRYPTII